MARPAPSANGAGTSRRIALKRWLATAAALGVWPVLGSASRATPSDERDRSSITSLDVLSQTEAVIYDAWCDQLAPGAAKAGASAYLDAQLAAAPAEALLLLRVLANPPFLGFYRESIAGIETETRARFGAGSSFTELTAPRKRQIIDAAQADTTTEWTDPSPSFFYLVSRADAVDVAYGTEAGFRRLKLPYLAHIRPPSPW